MLNNNDDLIPSLAEYVRWLWERSGQAQREFCVDGGISTSYLQSIMRGEKLSPTPQALAQMTKGWGLPEDEAMHLQALARMESNREWSSAALATELDPVQLHALNSSPHPAYCLNARTDILAANAAFSEWWPGYLDTPNALTWLVKNPISKSVVIGHALETLQTASLLRAAFVEMAMPEWAASLIEDVAGDDYFREIWSRRAVLYSRPSGYMHIWGPDGKPHSMLLGYTMVAARPGFIQMVTTTPEPYCGPEELLSGE